MDYVAIHRQKVHYFQELWIMSQVHYFQEFSKGQGSKLVLGQECYESTDISSIEHNTHRCSSMEFKRKWCSLGVIGLRML